MSASAVVELSNVHRVYPMGDHEVEALRGVSLRVDRGEYVAIMGPSGSGKSTMLGILGCLDRPTRGRYWLDGMDLAGRGRDELADVRGRKLGFVFQSFQLLGRTSALENVELPLLYHRGVSARARRERARRSLERVGLGDRAEHHPSQLSGGQQQRVAIARALVNEPALLLADEPTGNLDSRVTDEVLALFHALNEQGLTIVLVTHEPDVAARAGRTVVVRDGRIVDDRRRA